MAWLAHARYNCTVDSRAVRSAKNEALFREVNNRILDAVNIVEGEGLEVLCECGDAACADIFQITFQEYRAVRARGERFVMLAGHEDPALERVVERNERFIVVEKIGEAGEMARDLDPRP
jgi:hypothetical protein